MGAYEDEMDRIDANPASSMDRNDPMFEGQVEDYDLAYELVDNQSPGGSKVFHFGESYQPTLDELISVMTEDTYATYKGSKRKGAFETLFPMFIDLSGHDEQYRLPSGTTQVQVVAVDDVYEGEWVRFYYVELADSSNQEVEGIGTFRTKEQARRKAESVGREYDLKVNQDIVGE